MPFFADKIVDLYINQSLSCADIARLDGRSESTIYNILKAKKIKCRNRSQANKTFPNQFLIKLYNIGLSCSQIGKLLGLHSSTVIKRFKTCGFPMRDKKMATAIRYSEQEFKKYFYNSEFIQQLRLCAK